MSGSLTGKVAFVAGASRGIGATVAAALAREGAAVAVAARSEQEGKVPGTIHAVADRITSAGGRALAVSCDVTSEESVEAAVAATVSEFGGIDILINMASVYLRKPFDEMRAEDWDAVINVDLRAAFLCAMAAAPHMRRRGGGRIVNFSDWLSKSGRPRYRGFLPYYVAKAGVIALTEALALELAPDNVLVNAIAPGPIVAPPGTTDDELKAVERATPLGRWGGEREIAKTVLALLDSDFITGETIRVDGGRHVN